MKCRKCGSEAMVKNGFMETIAQNCFVSQKDFYTMLPKKHEV